MQSDKLTVCLNKGWVCQRAAGAKPSEGSLRRKLNSIKDEQFPWMRTKNAPQQPIKNLGAAFRTFLPAP
jgi:hypothetical protein